MGYVMRAIFIFLLSFMWCVHAQAMQSPLDLIEEGQDQAEEMEEMLMEALDTYFGVLIDCELDIVCVADKLEAKIKKTDNFIMSFMFEELLEVNKEAIKWNRENAKSCDIKELKVVQKRLTRCLPIIKEALSEKSEEMAGQWFMCVFKSMEPLAEKDNLFAAAVLADYFDKLGEKDLSQRYVNQIQKADEADHPHIEFLDKCMATWN